MTKWPEFDSLWRHEFLLLRVVQTSSVAHPASYPMGIGSFFLGGEAAGE
jgi:hypothetical protein